jgi:hypothetical protein
VKIISTCALLTALGGQSLLAFASEQDNSKGFLADSQWAVLNRSLYDRREYQNGAVSSGARNAFKPRAQRSDLAEEWAYGLMGDFSSASTMGIDRNASSHDRGFVVNYSNAKKGDSFDLIGVRSSVLKGLSASFFSEDRRQHALRLRHPWRDSAE